MKHNGYDQTSQAGDVVDNRRTSAGCDTYEQRSDTQAAARRRGRKPGQPGRRAELTDNPARRWAPVAGWEGAYEVSDDGFVRSVARHCRIWNGSRVVAPRVLRALPHPCGYRCVILHSTPRKLMAYVHRLVADAFLAPDTTRPEVNHKNGDKADNRVANLERCTKSENAIHARDVLGRQCGKRRSA